MKKIVSLLFIALALPQIAFAWGGQGHSTIAHIAERHLTAKAKANIESYINGRSIVHYASWMDFNRTTPPFDVTNNWHVDYWTNDERTDADGKPLPPNSVREIKRIIGQMDDFRTLSDSLVNINIKFLVHLVGDMHCPVHIDFPLSRPVKVTIEGNREIKFHKMWDGYVIAHRHKGCSPIQLATEFDIYTPEQIAKVQEGDPDAWYAETVVAARRALDLMPENKVLTAENYFNEAIVIAEDRMTVAGYRLAAILNSIFDK